MTSDQPRRERDAKPGDPTAPDAVIRLVTTDDEVADGGDPVCWAHLVCDECGAVTSEGHRAWCSHAGR